MDLSLRRAALSGVIVRSDQIGRTPVDPKSGFTTSMPACRKQVHEPPLRIG